LLRSDEAIALQAENKDLPQAIAIFDNLLLQLLALILRLPIFVH